VLAYELLTGASPFQAVSTDQALAPHLLCCISLFGNLCPLMTHVLCSPYVQPTPAETLARIRSAPIHIPDHLSPGARDFVARALTRDPAARPTMQVRPLGIP
jgi:serine/threonine protein kinase